MEYADKRPAIALTGVIEALGLKKQEDILARHWDASLRNCPDDMDFLNEDFIIAYNGYFGFPDDLLAIYNETVNLINRNKSLRMLAWHLHEILFNCNDEKNAREILSDWPCLQASMGELSDMFAAVIFVSGIKMALGIYRVNGIPDTVAKDTLDDLLRWINAHRKKTGKWGFSEYGWLYNHFHGRVFRFGRLQFQPGIFKDRVIVYRNKVSSKILVYSQKRVQYRQDGQIDGTSGIFDTQLWFSQFIKKDGRVIGNPINGNATCSRETLVINEDEWNTALNENDPVLNVHIPEGGKLDHYHCVRSYNEALSFFKEYFPELYPKAFVCHSWLMDIQLKKYWTVIRI